MGNIPTGDDSEESSDNHFLSWIQAKFVPQNDDDNDDDDGFDLLRSNRNRNASSIVRVGSQVFRHVGKGDGTREKITVIQHASNYDYARKAALYNLNQVGGLDPDRGVPGVVGFRNMGNTCYMNSAIQCLINTVPLIEYFLGYDYRQEINADNPLGSGGELATAYAKLIKKIWLKPAKSSKKTRSLKLKRLRSKICSLAPHFEGDDQHDAHEFLATVLDKIHEDLNRVLGKKPFIEETDNDGKLDQEQLAMDAWKRHLRRDKSVIVDIFQGQLRSVIQCCDCGYQNHRFDPFMYLSLPVNDTSKSLDHCLADFVKEEHMTGDNRWFCRDCQKLVDATRTTSLWVLPPVLIIQLKRFKYVGLDEKCSKLKKKLRYPILNWDLSNVVQSGAKDASRFDLYASVNHFGDLDGGHYTAFVSNQFDQQWHEFDDNEVRVINPLITFRASSSPYILFYKRSMTESTAIHRQSVSQPLLWPHLQACRDSNSRSSITMNRRTAVSETAVQEMKAEIFERVIDEFVDASDIERTTNYEDIEETVMNIFEAAGCFKEKTGDPAGVVGMRNLNSTSFMNSILQCLSNTGPLTDYFLGYDYRSRIKCDNALGSDNGELVIAFADLIKRVWLKTSSKRRVIVIKGFRKTISKFAPMFQGSQKHDSHEFLTLLLDGLHEDLNQADPDAIIEARTYAGYNDFDNAHASWQLYSQRHDSIIVDLFQGQLRNECECLTCGNVSLRFEPFMYLSLPIHTNSNSLDDCLASFVSEERLDGRNQWYCSICGTDVDARKRTEIWNLPPVLIVQLKRFHFQEDCGPVTKIDVTLKYPITGWDLKSLVQGKTINDVTYDLWATSNHVGPIDSGHYTAYARNRFNSSWYEFDDNKPRVIDPSDELECSSLPYILFYVLAEPCLAPCPYNGI